MKKGPSPAVATAGLVLGVLGLLAVLAAGERRLHASREFRTEAAAENVYRAAQEGHYADIKGSPDAVDELKRLERTSGRVQGSGPLDSFGGDGDSRTTILLRVQRGGRE